MKAWLKDQRNWRLRHGYYKSTNNELWFRAGVHRDMLERFWVVGVEIRFFKWYVSAQLAKPIGRQGR